MRRILTPALLLGTMLIPVAAVASQPSTDASVPTGNLRVSTGVTAPAILDTAVVEIPQGNSYISIPAGAQVGLTLTVDQNGAPQNIRVVKSLNHDWDAQVIEAVRHFHFRPGSMDNQAIPVDMNLIVNITK
jgi:TonB family protein